MSAPTVTRRADITLGQVWINKTTGAPRTITAIDGDRVRYTDARGQQYTCAADRLASLCVPQMKCL